MDTPDKHTLSLAGDVLALRKDVLQLMASNLALTETVIQLAESTAKQLRPELHASIIRLTQHFHQKLLVGLEDTSPGFAAILDDRREDEVDGATT